MTPRRERVQAEGGIATMSFTVGLLENDLLGTNTGVGPLLDATRSDGHELGVAGSHDAQARQA